MRVEFNKYIISLLLISFLFVRYQPYCLAFSHKYNPQNDNISLLTIGAVAGESIAAFTLAEVLITLTVVGILSSMAIPSLMNSTNDQELKTAWKKTFADLNNATKLILNDNGGSFVNITTTFDHKYFRDLYSKYLVFSKVCNDCGAEHSICWHAYVTNSSAWTLTSKLLNGTNTSDHYLPNGNISFGAVLSNGVLMSVSYSDANCTGSNWPLASNTCGWITVDVNGLKGPNVVGKDIFSVWVTKDRIIPFGGGCEGSDGMGCSAKYLLQ